MSQPTRNLRITAKSYSVTHLADGTPGTVERGGPVIGTVTGVIGPLNRLGIGRAALEVG